MVALVLISLLVGYRHGVSVTDNKCKAAEAIARAAIAEARATAEFDARVEEQRRQQTANETARHARNQNEKAAMHAADADRSGKRLLDDARQLAALSAQCPGNTGTASEARQPPAPPWCSPTCSKGLTNERESWRRRMTEPG